MAEASDVFASSGDFKGRFLNLVFTFIAVNITFDPDKRDTTLNERGIDFAIDAAKVFLGREATKVDGRFDYGEIRYSTVGWLNERMVMVIWTPRASARHVISMRYCHAKEAKRYIHLIQ